MSDKRSTTSKEPELKTWTSKEHQQDPDKTLDYLTATEDELKEVVDRLTARFTKA